MWFQTLFQTDYLLIKPFVWQAALKATMAIFLNFRSVHLFWKINRHSTQALLNQDSELWPGGKKHRSFYIFTKYIFIESYFGLFCWFFITLQVGLMFIIEGVSRKINGTCPIGCKFCCIEQHIPILSFHLGFCKTFKTFKWCVF